MTGARAAGFVSGPSRLKIVPEPQFRADRRNVLHRRMHDPRKAEPDADRIDTPPDLLRREINAHAERLQHIARSAAAGNPAIAMLGHRNSWLAGVPVAKHGNRGVSSSSGSCDVLEALGVRVELTPEQVGRCIDAIGIGFCFARVVHSAMRHVAPVRAELGFRTIFNLLGPLTNPARASYQIIGASRIATAQRLAEAIVRLGTQRTLVVCGNDELDEVSLWGTTTVFDVRGERCGRSTGRPRCWAWPNAVSMRCVPGRRPRVRGSSRPCSTSPRRRRSGISSSRTAAAALLAAGHVPTLGDGVRLAARTIDSALRRRSWRNSSNGRERPSDPDAQASGSLIGFAAC